MTQISINGIRDLQISIGPDPPRWPTVKLREILLLLLFLIRQQRQHRSFQPVTASTWSPLGNAARTQWGFWSLFLAVVSISRRDERKRFTATSMITLFSNLPGQYLWADTGIKGSLQLWQLWIWKYKHWHATVWLGCTSNTGLRSKQWFDIVLSCYRRQNMLRYKLGRTANANNLV